LLIKKLTFYKRKDCRIWWWIQSVAYSA
jgi:hypothetical protein